MLITDMSAKKECIYAPALDANPQEIMMVTPFLKPIINARDHSITGADIFCQVKRERKYVVKRLHNNECANSEFDDFYITQLLLKTAESISAHNMLISDDFIFSLYITRQQLSSDLVKDALIDFRKVLGIHTQILFEVEEQNTTVLKDKISGYFSHLGISGIRLMIDDSRVNHVKAIRLDRAVTKEKEGLLIHRDLIEIAVSAARTWELMVIAEGVDTENQKVALLNMGIDMMQGELYPGTAKASAFRKQIDKFSL